MKKINLINNPFSQFCINLGFAPTSYSEALAYEEQILWLIKFLEQTVIPSIQDCEEAVIELQGLYVELKNYVDHYFDNLDVQEEINNKLDEMAESGELTDIIAQYLQLAGVLAYDTISDMSEALNIVEGSICRTLGNDTYNDGKGAFYKVRTITSGDTIDGVNIVELDVSDTLIAERIPNYYIDEINGELSDINSTLNIIQNKKYIIIGDSYATGQNELQEQTTPFPTLIANILGLTLNSDLFVSAHNGSGFNNGYTFKAQIDEVYTDIDDPNEITDLIVVGGYNDRYYAVDVIDGKMEEFFTYAKGKFPNAKIKLGCVGWSKVYDVRQSIITRSLAAYSECSKYGVEYLNNVEWILHDYTLFSGDNYHPNQNGQNELAKYLTQAILTGSCDIQRWFGVDTESMISPIENTDTFNPSYCKQYQNNGIITMIVDLSYIVKTTAVTVGSATVVPLAKLTGGLIFGGGTEAMRTGGSVFVATSGGSGLAEVNGSYSVKYDSTNNVCLIEFISSKRSGSNSNIAAFNNSPISLVIPAAYC